eukprot:GEMP01017110.1.p1 GENE.GEMP01017110.1~~GEMP01017110.1.p1  ORF type:complete len:665 (+),score=149.30 GEMP01017110.1:604-2598(+)
MDVFSYFASPPEMLVEVCYEVIILLTFLCSYFFWHLSKRKYPDHMGDFDKTRYARKRYVPQQRENKSWTHNREKDFRQPRQDVRSHRDVELMPYLKQPTCKIIETIVAMCSEEFTKALRLYRLLVAQNRSNEIKDEAFYFALLQAAIRVGYPYVIESIFQQMRINGVDCSVAFFSSILKLLAAKHYYPHCLLVWELMGDQMPKDRIIHSCLAFAAIESQKNDMALDMGFRLTECDGATWKDFLNIFRAFTKSHESQHSLVLFRRLIDMQIPIVVVILNMVCAACVHDKDVDSAAELLEEFTPNASRSVSPVADVVTYNTVIKGYVERHDVDRAFAVLAAMDKVDVKPDDVTYGTLLDACMASNDLDKAHDVLNKFMESGCVMNTVVYTTFMKGFVKAHEVDKAMYLYESMRTNCKSSHPDLITFSVLIKANCDRRDMKSALYLLSEMRKQNYAPDDIVLNHLLDGCCHVADSGLGEKLFYEFTKPNGTVNPSPYTLSSLAKLYGKCGEMQKAFELVARMEQSYTVKPSVVIFTCLVSGCIRNRLLPQAVNAFDMMIEQGVLPDETSFQIFIQGCVQQEHPILALETLMKYSAHMNLEMDAPQAVGKDNKVLRSNKILPVEAVNHLLTVLLNRKLLDESRALYSFMLHKRVKVTVPKVCQRLQLQ